MELSLIVSMQLLDVHVCMCKIKRFHLFPFFFLPLSLTLPTGQRGGFGRVSFFCVWTGLVILLSRENQPAL